jgi:hypothetical protein
MTSARFDDLTPDARHPGPVRFALAKLPLPPDDILLFHKTTARDQYRGRGDSTPMPTTSCWSTTGVS